MPSVNPEILRWARETAGLSLAEAVKKIQLNDAYGKTGAERLAELEAGEENPTRALLGRMADKYRRPLITFYLSEPPEKSDRGEDFRTLPDVPSPEGEVVLDTLLRRLKAAQELVRAALLDEGDHKPLPFINSMSRGARVRDVVASIREVVDLHLDSFRKPYRTRDAFNLLRGQVEAVGIYVILAGDLGSWHTELEVETYRGISLTDDIAPFVAINPNDSSGALCFSLVHELAHLWLGESGVSGGLPTSDIEQFCDDVASEFLLPEEELKSFVPDKPIELDSLEEQLSMFADDRNVSSSMVAYKLYRNGIISFQNWTILKDRFRRHWTEERRRRRQEARASDDGSAPGYWTIRQHRIGHGLLNTTARLVGSGEISTSEASTILGVKPQQVGSLMEAAGIQVGG